MTEYEMRYQLFQEAKNYVNPLMFKGHEAYREAIRIAKELEAYIIPNNNIRNDENEKA